MNINYKFKIIELNILCSNIFSMRVINEQIWEKKDDECKKYCKAQKFLSPP